jgi:hypothetical protein
MVYWMVFSNKERYVKRGDRVGMEIGKFRGRQPTRRVVLLESCLVPVSPAKLNSSSLLVASLQAEHWTRKSISISLTTVAMFFSNGYWSAISCSPTTYC